MSLMQELMSRGVRFAPRDGKPFSQPHPTLVLLNLSHDEAEELRHILFDRETERLSRQRCNACSVGQIVREKSSHNGVSIIRYSCTCDGSVQINPSDWVPIADPTEKTST